MNRSSCAALLALALGVGHLSVLAQTAPTLSIADASVVEGDDGVGFLIFTVTRAGDTTNAVSFVGTSIDGTATEGVDHNGLSVRGRVDAGETTAVFAVGVLGDTDFEMDETLRVQIGSAYETGGAFSFVDDDPGLPGSTGQAAVGVGDFDFDGRIDVAVLSQSDESVLVLHNQSEGGVASFESAGPFPSGAAPTALTVSDITRDGYADILAVNAGADTLTVLVKDPLESGIAFGDPVSYDIDAGVEGVRVFDVDFDQYQDVLLIDTGADQVTIWRALADGTFAAPVSFATADAPRDLTLDDFNGDGLRDLAVACDGGVSLLRGTHTPGTISFATHQDIAAGNAPRAIVHIDVENDGRADLVVANTGSTDLRYLRNTSAAGGTLSIATFQTLIPVGAETHGLMAADDVDVDGRSDLVAVNRDADTVTFLRRTVGGPTLFEAQPYATGDGPIGAVFVTPTDFDGDGLSDLVVANGGDDTVSLLRGSGPAVVITDAEAVGTITNDDAAPPPPPPPTSAPASGGGGGGVPGFALLAALALGALARRRIG